MGIGSSSCARGNWSGRFISLHTHRWSFEWICFASRFF